MDAVPDDDFTSLRYETRDRKAYVTLDRPERLNAIDGNMPREIRLAVERANDDPSVHVIVLPWRLPRQAANAVATLAAEYGPRVGLVLVTGHSAKRPPRGT